VARHSGAPGVLIDPDFWIFAAVGVAAQLIDGALGMGYGVVSSTVLLSLGVPPASVSASVHAAKTFTGAASAISHAIYRNVDVKLLVALAAGGMLGGVLGAYILTNVDGKLIKPYVVAWLGVMGLVILWRAWRGTRPKVMPNTRPFGLGLVGGFFDAVGGGGGGPSSPRPCWARAPIPATPSAPPTPPSSSSPPLSPAPFWSRS